MFFNITCYICRSFFKHIMNRLDLPIRLGLMFYNFAGSWKSSASLCRAPWKSTSGKCCRIDSYLVSIARFSIVTLLPFRIQDQQHVHRLVDLTYIYYSSTHTLSSIFKFMFMNFENQNELNFKMIKKRSPHVGSSYKLISFTHSFKNWIWLFYEITLWWTQIRKRRVSTE